VRLAMLLLFLGVATARAESITVDGKVIEVVGRKGIPLADLQLAAAEYPHAYELAISSLYYDRGFATAKVDDEQGRCVILEGDVFRFRTVRALDTVTNASHQVRHLRKGKLFSRALIHAEVSGIERALRDTGHAFASVVPVIKLDLPAKQIDLTIEIERGPITRIHAIEVDGNVRISDATILARIGLAAGRLYNESALTAAKTTLEELGLTNVAVATKRVPGHEDRVHVTIEVTEP
jgi:outer membrane protein assembly factor BamA